MTSEDDYTATVNLRRAGGAWSDEALQSARIDALQNALAEAKAEQQRLRDALHASIAVHDQIYHFLSDVDRRIVERLRAL